MNKELQGAIMFAISGLAFGGAFLYMAIELLLMNEILPMLAGVLSMFTGFFSMAVMFYVSNRAYKASKRT